MTSPKEARITEMLQEIDDAEANEEFEELDAQYRRPRPPKKPSQVYSVRVPVDRLKQLRELADRKGVSASALVRQLVVEGLERLIHRSSEIEALQDRVTELEERDARREKDLSESLEKHQREVINSLSSLASLTQPTAPT